MEMIGKKIKFNNQTLPSGHRLLIGGEAKNQNTNIPYVSFSLECDENSGLINFSSSYTSFYSTSGFAPGNLFKDFEIDPNGDLYFFMNHNNLNGPDLVDFSVIKILINGNIDFAKTISNYGKNDDYKSVVQHRFSMDPTDLNNFTLFGQCYNHNLNVNEIYFSQFDSQFNPILNKKITNRPNLYASKVSESTGGNGLNFHGSFEDPINKSIGLNSFNLNLVDFKTDYDISGIICNVENVDLPNLINVEINRNNMEQNSQNIINSLTPLKYQVYNHNSFEFCLSNINLQKSKSFEGRNRIFPNPSSKFEDISIEFLDINKDLEFKIINNLGVVIYQGKSQSTNGKLVLNEFKTYDSGVYFLQVFEDSKIIMNEKIIRY